MIGEILQKLASGVPLSEQDKQNLRLFGNQTELNNSWIKEIQGAGGQINPQKINASIESLHSKTLEADTLSVTFPVSSQYKHLWLMGSGRTTSNNPSYPIQDIYCRFNGDTGNNYDFSALRQNSTTVDAIESIGNSAVLVGTFNTAYSSADMSGAFFTVIPNYNNSIWHKTAISLRAGAYMAVYSRMSPGFWRSKNPISSLTLFPDTGVGGSFSAGTIFTIIGIL